MTDDGIRALAPIVATPGTVYGTILTVPPGKEWTVRLLRAVNITTTPSVISVSLGTGGVQQIAHNEVVSAASETSQGAKNIIGPDFITLPAGSVIQARAGAANNVRLIASVTERDVG